ncbi:hypothetical protein WN48_01404 [Eufriesea mexicana]|uniref:Uncharacterized protein n=1 Tax=Eufriesea mexicana TaxID=516756 RepID=A0A310SGR2_9HYME|nr:hypothetical protein WN48_01404 [Eufriesea mexicana]
MFVAFGFLFGFRRCEKCILNMISQLRYAFTRLSSTSVRCVLRLDVYVACEPVAINTVRYLERSNIYC